ncbi:MAG: cob(I)yrinic acid a,c-diamide adenosyltransferase [Halanaerobiales bacterium]|nr:cob(I)yrinic acid a,c-diamide adenosyltransferase [Halanaerobiales bacterium]
MKIYTRSGDKGKTSLYDNSRVLKDSVRVESYGTVDELNSYLGYARSLIEQKDVCKIIKDIQIELFNVAGELATPDSKDYPKKVAQENIKQLEDIIDSFIEGMGEKQFNKFIVPGSNRSSSALHVARTICRRAERRVISLANKEEIRGEIIRYINRLSDLIYILAVYLESDMEYINFNKDQKEG